MCRPSLSLCTFAAKTEAKAHPGGDRGPRDAEPWPPELGPRELQPERRMVLRPARVTVAGSRARQHPAPRPASRDGPGRTRTAPRSSPTCRAPPPLRGAYLYPQVGSRAWLRCARSCPRVGSASGISSGQVRFWSRTRSFMAAPGGLRGQTPRRRRRWLRRGRAAPASSGGGPRVATTGAMGLLRFNGEKALPRRTSCRPVLGTWALRPPRAPPGAHPASGQLEAYAQPSHSGTRDRWLGAQRRPLRGEERTAQAPRLPPGSSIAAFALVAGAPLFSRTWRKLTQRGMLQARLLATLQGPGVPGSYPSSSMAPDSGTFYSETLAWAQAVVVSPDTAKLKQFVVSDRCQSILVIWRCITVNQSLPP